MQVTGRTLELPRQKKCGRFKKCQVARRVRSSLTQIEPGSKNAECGFESHDRKLQVGRPRPVGVEKQTIHLIREGTEARKNLRHQTRDQGTVSDVGATLNVAPDQFVLDHKRLITAAVERQQRNEEAGIIGPKRADKSLRREPMVKRVCIAQTAEGVIGGSRVPYASSVTNKIQEGSPAVCSDPTVLGEIESYQP